MPSRARQSRQKAIAAGGAVVGRGKSTKLTVRQDQKARAVLDTIGRVQLVEVLQSITPEGDEGLRTPSGRLLAYLEDHSFDGSSITKLARDAGLLLHEIVDLTCNYHISMGRIQAARHVPQVLDDIGEDAKSRLVPCLKCGGSGKEGGAIDDELLEILGDTDALLEEFPDCEYCNGSGHLRQIGDSDSRKILLETMGIYNKKGPAVAIQKNTQINNNYAGGSPPEDAAFRIQKIIDS